MNKQVSSEASIATTSELVKKMKDGVLDKRFKKYRQLGFPLHPSLMLTGLSMMLILRVQHLKALVNHRKTEKCNEHKHKMIWGNCVKDNNFS